MLLHLLFARKYKTNREWAPLDLAPDLVPGLVPDLVPRLVPDLVPDLDLVAENEIFKMCLEFGKQVTAQLNQIFKEQRLVQSASVKSARSVCPQVECLCKKTLKEPTSQTAMRNLPD
ncbi:hypothetical protein Ddc_18603 [Ditylenchus destructor]|nr:hypothetical protein Ddc_18603 [Ditylenchus destructor]